MAEWIDTALQACITVSGTMLHRVGPKEGRTLCGFPVFDEVEPDEYVGPVPEKCSKCWPFPGVGSGTE